MQGDGERHAFWSVLLSDLLLRLAATPEPLLPWLTRQIALLAAIADTNAVSADPQLPRGACLASNLRSYTGDDIHHDNALCEQRLPLCTQSGKGWIVFTSTSPYLGGRLKTGTCI